ncbi:hypothetical protein GCM10009605_11390 [Nocardiopsis composta]
MRLRGGVPAPVEERPGGVPLRVGRGAGEHRVEGVPGLRVPGLGGAQGGRLPALLLGEVDAESPAPGGDQDQRAHPLGVPGRVQHRQVARRGVGQQVDPVQAEVGAERLDVAGLPVAPVAGRVGAGPGAPGAARVGHDQPAPPRQPAQAAEVGAGAHRAAGQADQRFPLAFGSVGELGPVGCGEGGHGAILPFRTCPGKRRPPGPCAVPAPVWSSARRGVHRPDDGIGRS